MSCPNKSQRTATTPPPILKTTSMGGGGGEASTSSPKHSVRFQSPPEQTSSPTLDMSKDVSSHTFWSDNPNVLLNSLEFYPLDTMTFAQKLNAITRSLLVLTLIALFFTQHPVRLLFISLMSMVGIWAMYEYYHGRSTMDQEGMAGFDGSNGSNGSNGYLDVSSPPGHDRASASVPTYQQPTPENPFGNVLVTDYEDNPHKLSAPPASHAVVQNLIQQNAMQMVQEVNPGQPNIGDKLFRDINEQLNFEQSMRPFHSNPATTIPNDQGAFAQFCYGDMISCKEGNLVACSRNTGHYTNY